jgi:hypothetical protein
MTMRIMHGVQIKEMPMAMLLPHEKQAIRNHGQSLHRLNERGGIDAAEALAILQDQGWQQLKVPLAQCEQDLIVLVDKFKEKK